MSKMDIEQLKRAVDLLAVVQLDTVLNKVANTQGGEYAGKCPFCGGQDRFRVQPERRQWWCRQCSPDNRWQDVIAYIMRRDQVDFREAVSQLSNGDLSSSFKSAESVTPAVLEQTAEWRALANEVATRCATLLWADTRASRGVLTWLKRRGLNEATLRAWQIGYNPVRQNLAGLWVEAGITLPYYVRGQIQAINVRRSDVALKQNPHKAKYVMVKGSQRALFGADHLMRRPDVVISEGEFDALLVWQEAGDFVDVLTMGAAGKMPNDLSLVYLLPAERFFIATDNDPAGDAAAAKWLHLVGERGRRCRVPQGKDVTEYWQSGANVRQWVHELRLGATGRPTPSLTELRPGESIIIYGDHRTLSDSELYEVYKASVAPLASWAGLTAVRGENVN